MERWETGSFRSNLCADIYEVTITDGQGCEFILTETLSAPEAILIEAETFDSNCRGEANGSIDLTISGGTPEYSYQWNTGHTTEDLADIEAGLYLVTVRDANGCNSIESFTVNEPATSMVVSGLVTDVMCFGQATGMIYPTVAGGTDPYTYLWSNGSTELNQTDLLAGEYSLVANDALGCSVSTDFTVSAPTAPLSATGSTTDVQCFGEATGTISVIPEGGTAPYSYLWSDGSTDQNLTDLVAGPYDLTLTDAAGCTFSTIIIIGEPSAALTAVGTASNVLCYGDATGAINLQVDGGTEPYSYLWSNGSSEQNQSDLTAGTYSVTVSDAFACKYQRNL